jgi:RNA polymerase sigma-70 factor, ECF subfamily
VVTQTEPSRALEGVFRVEFPKLVASLTRMLGDVGLAEELAQDAIVAALEHWPREGTPEKPGAWLMATAKRRAIDVLRRGKRVERDHAVLGREQDELSEASVSEREAAVDADIGDDLLRLVFVACHPLLSTEARVALTLRLLGGLTTEEIARAFLTPEPTIAQRIVRAKRTLSDARVPFEVPRAAELAPRLASVLEVVYLIFNEGYSATRGDDWMRPHLCDDARRLGSTLSELAPDEPEVFGLVALMDIQASRARARVAPDGEPILLLEQDRSLWDGLLIAQGLVALERALSLTLSPGPYVLQAALAACHARALVAEETDWRRIVMLYGELARVAPSPIVELNRAVAVSMAEGPAAALVIVDGLTREPALAGYHLLPAVRGDLLAKIGRFAEARTELERAAALTKNAREKKLLLERAAALVE